MSTNEDILEDREEGEAQSEESEGEGEEISKKRMVVFINLDYIR